MSVSKYDYEYNVCPHCRSKRVVAATMSPEYSVAVSGHVCENCSRFVPWFGLRGITDKAEIKRDIKRLKSFLNKG